MLLSSCELRAHAATGKRLAFLCQTHCRVWKRSCHQRQRLSLEHSRSYTPRSHMAETEQFSLASLSITRLAFRFHWNAPTLCSVLYSPFRICKPLLNCPFSPLCEFIVLTLPMSATVLAVPILELKIVLPSPVGLPRCSSKLHTDMNTNGKV